MALTAPDIVYKEKLPWKQVLSLSSANFSQAVMLTTPFTIGVFMVRDFEAAKHGGQEDQVDEQVVGRLTGLLAGIFSFSGFLTAYGWGCASNYIGRKPVIVIGNAVSFVSILWFGLAGSYGTALAARAFGGFFNGILGAWKCMIGESTHVLLQGKFFGYMSLAWGLGCIAGPALGGAFSRPCKRLPNLPLCGQGSLLAARPYFLSCLVGSLAILAAFLLSVFLLEETLPHSMREKGLAAALQRHRHRRRQRRQQQREAAEGAAAAAETSDAEAVWGRRPRRKAHHAGEGEGDGGDDVPSDADAAEDCTAFSAAGDRTAATGHFRRRPPPERSWLLRAVPWRSDSPRWAGGGSGGGRHQAPPLPDLSRQASYGAFSVGNSDVYDSDAESSYLGGRQASVSRSMSRSNSLVRLRGLLRLASRTYIGANPFESRQAQRSQGGRVSYGWSPWRWRRGPVGAAGDGSGTERDGQGSGGVGCDGAKDRRLEADGWEEEDRHHHHHHHQQQQQQQQRQARQQQRNGPLHGHGERGQEGSRSGDVEDPWVGDDDPGADESAALMAGAGAHHPRSDDSAWAADPAPAASSIVVPVVHSPQALPLPSNASSGWPIPRGLGAQPSSLGPNTSHPGTVVNDEPVASPPRAAAVPAARGPALLDAGVEPGFGPDLDFRCRGDGNGDGDGSPGAFDSRSNGDVHGAGSGDGDGRAGGRPQSAKSEGAVSSGHGGGIGLPSASSSHEPGEPSDCSSSDGRSSGASGFAARGGGPAGDGRRPLPASDSSSPMLTTSASASAGSLADAGSDDCSRGRGWKPAAPPAALPASPLSQPAAAPAGAASGGDAASERIPLLPPQAAVSISSSPFSSDTPTWEATALPPRGADGAWPSTAACFLSAISPRLGTGTRVNTLDTLPEDRSHHGPPGRPGEGLAPAPALYALEIAGGPRPLGGDTTTGADARAGGRDVKASGELRDVVSPRVSFEEVSLASRSSREGAEGAGSGRRGHRGREGVGGGGGDGGGGGGGTCDEGKTKAEAVEGLKGASEALLPWYRYPQVVLTILGYGATALIFCALDEVFPIFAAAPRSSGGLGMREEQIAVPLMFFGAVLMPYSLWGYPPLQRRVGTLRMTRVGLLTSVATCLLIPLVANAWSASAALAMVLLYLSMVVKAFAQCSAFTGSIIAVNAAPAPEQLGAVNGVGQTLAALVRGVGPALGGVMWAVSLGLHSSGQQFLTFCLIAVVALANWGLYNFVRLPNMK